MKIKTKLISSIIATGLLVTPVLNIVGNNLSVAKANNNTIEKKTYNNIYYANLFLKVLEEEKENFTDPTYFDEIKSKFEDKGKFTLAGKVGAKALKEAIQRIGKKSWDNAIIKLEKMTPWQIGKLNYDSIIDFLNITVNFSDNVEKILSDYLVRNGFDRDYANRIAWFITFALF